ncbi:hypothetical protein DMENIID0001_155160 [Sergentomyia squamirostris]
MGSKCSCPSVTEENIAGQGMVSATQQHAEQIGVMKMQMQRMEWLIMVLVGVLIIVGIVALYRFCRRKTTEALRRHALAASRATIGSA